MTSIDYSTIKNGDIVRSAKAPSIEYTYIGHYSDARHVWVHRGTAQILNEVSFFSGNWEVIKPKRKIRVLLRRTQDSRDEVYIAWTDVTGNDFHDIVKDGIEKNIPQRVVEIEYEDF